MLNFSKSLLDGTVEQLQDNLKKVSNFKDDLIKKQFYEQAANARDWEKALIAEIELRTNRENQPPTGVQL